LTTLGLQYWLRPLRTDAHSRRFLLTVATTMEMGVDIGSVSSVMMTNVPPSIANYRQRAARRGQAVALAFTFCEDRPLDSETFRDPQAYLQRSLAAPRVTLSSRPIVQRHVNDQWRNSSPGWRVAQQGT